MKQVVKTLIAVAAIAACGAASAVDINSYTFDGSSASIAYLGNPETVLAGEISINSSIGSFATYCIDLVNVFGVPSSGYSFGSYASDEISRLVTFAGFYGGSDQSSNAVNTTVEKTAFQLAIWDAVYDPGTFDLTSGQFTVTSADAGVVTQANAYLAGAFSLPPGSYATDNLYAFTGGVSQQEVRSQDLITAIPEPSTYALMLAGLAGVGFVVRRRSQHSN